MNIFFIYLILFIGDDMERKVNKEFVISLLIPSLVGLISGLLSMGGIKAFDLLNKPPLTPPGFIFAIIWPILYILMGISSYLVYEKEGEVPRIYVVQLIFNLLWSFVFFTFKWYTFAFIWIIILFFLVLRMIREFRQIDKTAGNLQIPYAIWLIVAAVLNLMKIL